MGNITSSGPITDLLSDSCYNVKTAADSQSCNITWVTQTQTGHMLLVDNSNSKLKMYDQNFQFVSQITLPAAPWAATQVSSLEVAVTLPSERTVQFVNLQEEILTEQNFRTRCQCYGILFMKGQLVISGKNGAIGQVEILTENGKIIRRIVHDAKGKDLFIEPYYLSTSLDGTVIYVTDMGKDSVYGINMAAQTVFVNRRFSSPTGITVFADGNMLVADGRSHSIQIVSRNGKQVKPFISHYIELRNCLLYCPDLDKLIVTMKNSNKIKVFSWQRKPESLCNKLEKKVKMK